MIGSTETMRSPEEIQNHIAERRALLDAKIHELERRLSPREQLARVRAQLNPEPYLGVLAATAVAAGAALAYGGWRRVHHSNGNHHVMDDPIATEMMGE
jgi:hypothetical protein